MNFKELSKKIIGKETAAIFFAAVCFRIVVYVFSVLILAMQSIDMWSFELENFIAGWTRWDALHYVKIAELGYEGAIENGQHLFLVFFPLFPYLMRAAGVVIGNTELAGMLVSTLTYAGGCVYLYRIGEKHAGKEAGRNLALLVAAYPFSFFFGGIMTESLFLLVSAATLYYLDEHKWWWAVLFGALATMTRIQGVLLGIPALIEAFMVYRPDKALKEKAYKQLRGFVGRCASFLFMLLGLVYYLWINYRVEGDPFRFLYYQETHWGQGEGNIFSTIAYIFKYSFDGTFNISAKAALWVPQMVLVILSVVFLVFSVKKIRPMYYFYGAAYIFLTFSVPWLISGGRYFACNIPLFLVVAITGVKRKRFFAAAAILSVMLQMIYLTGFLQGKLIM
ncbi:MAG: glycosyltransferase family 39 protein [Lachnospiraceae bacterium]|nr:glycosyltransferase family 39 protein [Lachnospiraceae bacterium]